MAIVDPGFDDVDAGEPDEREPEPQPSEAGEGTASGAPVEELRGLVLYLAGNLVDDPEGVDVEAQQRGAAVHLTLRVPADELGKVIGRQGRIARAIRTAVTIAGARSNLRASLDIEG
ncbi:MAG: KH domain RNA binding protein YlqC [uncultured Thermomicrobiales bacterium]|uniref:RNA-binding protein KhpA n=1 Tax=uncultured Thermomicrobiales bacterium TaxID=1645740 RepID=A0A6J4U0V5_9BACT|nr:MAG: KH domain RNA binding protein YlqC [uncultured Thermomicrobiales bacterium]